MIKYSTAAVTDEIALCTKLYPGFSQATNFMEAVFKARVDFSQEVSENFYKSLSANHCCSRLLPGQSFFGEFSLQLEDFPQFARRLCTVVEEAQPNVGEAMAKLREFFQSNDDFPAIAGIPDFFQKVAQQVQVGPDLVTTLCSTALSAIFDSNRATTLDLSALSGWQGGNCPICGLKPHYGYLRKPDGAKVLECWMCGFSWVYPRLNCPFCDNTDQGQKGYFFLEVPGKVCRIDFCKSCHKYLKIFDLRELDRDGIMLPIHNLGTVTHDHYALKEGFQAGSELQWVS